MKKIVLIIVAALSLTSCFKKVGFETELVLYPKVQPTSKDDFAVAQGVTAYAYYVSSEDWKVLSYEDAVAKIITNDVSGATKNEPNVEAEPYATEENPIDELGRLKMKTSKQHLLLVAVYPTAEMFAYRHYEVGENLPVTTMKFHFRPWKSVEYVDSGWTCNKKPSTEAEQPTE